MCLILKAAQRELAYEAALSEKAALNSQRSQLLDEAKEAADDDDAMKKLEFYLSQRKVCGGNVVFYVHDCDCEVMRQHPNKPSGCGYVICRLLSKP